MLKLKNDEEYGKFLADRMSAPKAEIIHDVPEEYEMRINWFVQAAAAYALMRDYQSALNSSRSALELEMGHSALLGNVATYMLGLGHPSEASELAEKAIELAEDSGEWRALHLCCAKLIAAAAYAKLGELERAAELDKSIDLSSINGDIRGTYNVMRCIYFAYAGLEDELNKEMDEAFYNDTQPESWPKGYARAMFERDVAFDPYRNSEWFVHKVGITL